MFKESSFNEVVVTSVFTLYCTGTSKSNTGKENSVCKTITLFPTLCKLILHVHSFHCFISLKIDWQGLGWVFKLTTHSDSCKHFIFFCKASIINYCKQWFPVRNVCKLKKEMDTSESRSPSLPNLPSPLVRSVCTALIVRSHVPG